MKLVLFLIFLYFCIINGDGNDQISDKTALHKKPSVLIVSLVRNKAHTIPYFFSYLQELNYPKDRISLFLRTDHNEDNSKEIIDVWLKSVQHEYHNVNYEFDDGTEKLRKSENNKTHWSVPRFLDLIRMKEEALEYARNIWADYIFLLDADTFLTSADALNTLIELNRPIVAPMLASEGLYSNFWCGMSKDYYYKRTPDYKKIRNYEVSGEFDVPMVHTAVLINLKLVNSNQLTFNKTKLENFHDKKYTGPIDDIIIFAISANLSNTKMTISNTHSYGYVLVPIDDSDSADKDFQQVMNIKLFIINYMDDIKLIPSMEQYISYPKKTKLNFNEIYMINLERRTERRVKMEKSFMELGLDYTYFPAVDGKTLTDELLIQKGIKLMPEYVDPYHLRPMTAGEIGCFLSHYTIWQKIVDNNQDYVLVLEDDLRFEPYFNLRAESLLREAKMIGGWDLIYFGRKRLQDDEEYLEQSQNFVKVRYSYWTLGYVLTLAGAKKLLAVNPLENIIPVDEFLPIMYSSHPNESLIEHFKDAEKLVAWSVAPLLFFPTKYTGEEGYVSDTEDSIQIQLDNDRLNANIRVDDPKSTPNIEDGGFMRNALHGNRDSSEL